MSLTNSEKLESIKLCDEQVRYYDEAQRGTRKLASGWFLGTIVVLGTIASKGSSAGLTEVKLRCVWAATCAISAIGIYLLFRIERRVYQPIIRSSLASAMSLEKSLGQTQEDGIFLRRLETVKAGASTTLGSFYLGLCVLLVVIGLACFAVF